MTKEELNAISNSKDPYENIADRGNVGIVAYVAWRQGFEVGFKEAISIIRNTIPLPPDVSKLLDDNFGELMCNLSNQINPS